MRDVFFINVNNSSSGLIRIKINTGNAHIPMCLPSNQFLEAYTLFSKRDLSSKRPISRSGLLKTLK